MPILDTLQGAIDKTLDTTEVFLKTTEAYYELKLFQILTTTLTILVKFILITALFFIALVFLAIALAISIGEVYDNFILGCILTALSFIVLAVLVYIFRKPIESKIIATLSKAL